jgi:hypothetical protein
VVVPGDVLLVERDGEEVARSMVEGLGRFATAARDLRLGWGVFSLRCAYPDPRLSWLPPSPARALQGERLFVEVSA